MEPKTGKDPIPAADRKPETYEAPAVERVMSAEDLTREIHYAGTLPPSRTIG
jgi:hypothetical protein